MNLVWFRSDLRITDNPALWHACQSGETMGCIFLPIDQWTRYGLGTRKINFVKESALALCVNLKQLNIDLIIKEVASFDEQLIELDKLCAKKSINHIYWNNEYPLDERLRDDKVEQHFNQQNIATHRSQGALIHAPGQILNGQGKMYKVFTPFKKAWMKKVTNTPPAQFSIAKINSLDTQKGAITAGEQAALFSLDRFIGNQITQYHDLRDIPDTDASSKLSAHLSAGTLSPRSLLQSILAFNYGELISANEGVNTWLSQLIWREFYYHIIALNDSLSKYQPYKSETSKLIWNPPTEAFERWKAGKTGVPIVDAGMRQLNQTGWMHNRLRMVTAMYLTKNLFIDWRQGEKYFLNKLIDADFALNNGGWQWSASTGTDAAPYFRVFNPFRQAERFDPEANFIKRYVPELKELPAKVIHSESRLTSLVSSNYPRAIVDTRSSRNKAIAAFKIL